MLALADAIAVLVAIVAVDFLTSADVQQAFWAALFLPVWLVLAKLFGLYDRDHTALRHLTVDELPARLGTLPKRRRKLNPSRRSQRFPSRRCHATPPGVCWTSSPLPSSVSSR